MSSPSARSGRDPIEGAFWLYFRPVALDDDAAGAMQRSPAFVDPGRRGVRHRARRERRAVCDGGLHLKLASVFGGFNSPPWATPGSSYHSGLGTSSRTGGSQARASPSSSSSFSASGEGLDLRSWAPVTARRARVGAVSWATAQRSRIRFGHRKRRGKRTLLVRRRRLLRLLAALVVVAVFLVGVVGLLEVHRPLLPQRRLRFLLPLHTLLVLRAGWTRQRPR